ncbi:MAG: transglycosylase SLT domain-containing protein [Gammaproteobacteria bacterium]|nr:transglycosylase SLT domain-containing protein [Gammaproteobacteria bacterium]
MLFVPVIRCFLSALALALSGVLVVIDSLAAGSFEFELPGGMPGEVHEVARAGDIHGLMQWAQRFEHGESVDKDADKAVALYCVAAQRGHGPAEFALGWMYANGRGVKRSDALAGPWVWRAAARGDALAARLLPHFPLEPDGPPAQCILSDGTEFLPPLHSVPNPSRKLIMHWVNELAPRAGLDPRLVLAMIEMESGFNAKAKSPKNARGLMQLLPKTARRFDIADEWDPLENVRGGVAYMRWLLRHFEGNVSYALAGYNAGEGAVERHGGIPPYKETQHFVKTVLRICRAAHAGRWRFELTPAERKRFRVRKAAPPAVPERGLTSCLSG